jgi:hypothetical protein
MARFEAPAGALEVAGKVMRPVAIAADTIRLGQARDGMAEW